MTRTAVVICASLVVSVAAAMAARAQTVPAYFLRSLSNPAERREARSELLDTPVLPGSLMKTVTLVAALESQVIEPDTARMCRRTVTVGRTTYTCSHPDLKRPLTAAEALAHSCNDFFVSLAPRLTRTAFNQVRTRLGLPAIAADADLAASFVGLDGPRITPRALLDVVARLAGVEAARPVAVSADARRVLRDGLRGAASYGTAAALQTARVQAFAKTGTAPMPGGGWMGLAVALAPVERPTHGIVVVAPGAAGSDAAAVAAELLAGRTPTDAGGLPSAPGPPARAATAAVPAQHPRPAAKPGRTLRVSVNGRVSTLELEDYVARVVAGEGQPKAAAAAQQALAITARTFALANLQRHRREGYDLCDTTHCQVVRPATAFTREAARATAGKVLMHEGQPATVFYSAWCGGQSELASEVWPGAVDYSSHSHEDEACRDEPGWSNEIRVQDIERALRAAGHRGSRLRDLRIVQRNASGRVSRLRVDGFTPGEISGHDFRMAVGRVAGWQLLKSTAFQVRRVASGYRFNGSGFGHGVGLCVIGAGSRAARGIDAEQILGFYFPSLTIEPYDGPRTQAPRTVATAARGAKPVTPAATDVLMALPAAEEPQRAGLLQLVRTARDDIAAKAGVKAPTSLRVTVHPTVDAFARATGQPWWVSGASNGTTIDLLPLAILRQRGQLERTVRHEVAHLLIDAALADRRLWVREGAAFYFADPAAAASVEAGSCPSDEEFLRPLSAGTHRAAYARAEACFRRALARGADWREVR